MAARRPNQPKELVRLSPLQFSLSISLIVILLGAAALAGYFYGLRKGSLPVAGTGSESATNTIESSQKPDREDTQASVTFYSTLTKPRKDLPSSPPPVEKSSKTPVLEKVVTQPPGDSGVKDLLSSNGKVMLQVASYKNQDSARKLLQDLSSEGYDGVIVKADLGERGVWFRVRVGPYGTEKDARNVLDVLGKERGLKGYVVK